MAVIIPFTPRQQAERTPPLPGHSAQILLYTGVRYERDQEFAPVKPPVQDPTPQTRRGRRRA
jgi:hypothetical protein